MKCRAEATVPANRVGTVADPTGRNTTFKGSFLPGEVPDEV
jgi:hypothetical protein